MTFFFVSDFPVAHGAADVVGGVRELGVNGALPVLTPAFLFPASPALILYPKVVVFFLKAKDARGQAQGLVRRRDIERNARIAESATTVEMRNPPVGVWTWISAWIFAT